ncbi:Na+/H+ antiporter subunit E [Candidatus Blastococcus massiliensis]|uniref:Na+/H+ antiporter subunit E n=1 Tax=Candidatus Blastococcus massiliensis TaxID=1470358 RepID=UPI0004B89D08|nr:Na+/H+ antiporter subunit E [Candidatus Blastococcus massiliensis]
MSRRWGLRRATAIIRFSGWYLVQFLRANYTVAKEIVTPGDGLAPAFVEVPLQVRTRFEIASYISLVTLSPGTLVIRVSEDRTRLVAHGMHAGDPAVFRADLLEIERRMLAAWRPPRPPRERTASADDRTTEGGPT